MDFIKSREPIQVLGTYNKLSFDTEEAKGYVIGHYFTLKLF